LKKHPSGNLDKNEENELISGLMCNNHLSYEILVRNYSDKMYAVARRFFSTDDDAQECLQKAFIQVFKHISAFKKDSSLTTWLHRITVNEALMIIRQKKRQNTASLEEFSQHYNEHGERTVFTDNSGNNVEIAFEKGEIQRSINDIIYQLPDKYCNVILLRDIQERSIKETAAMLVISEAAVKTQLHRARLLLKEILEQQDKDSLENNWKVN